MQYLKRHALPLGILLCFGSLGCKQRTATPPATVKASDAPKAGAREPGAGEDEVTLREMLQRSAAADQGALVAAFRQDARADGALALTDPASSKDLARLDKLTLVEGDIVATPNDHEPGLDLAVSNEKTWPHGIVPYVFPPNLNPKIRTNALAAMAHIEEKTKVRFASYRPAWHASYLTFAHEPDRDSSGICAAELGHLKKKPQYVWLGAPCTRGALIHELGHSLSLAHEHNRRDRDDHINIHWENLRFESKVQFNQVGSGYVNTYGSDRGTAYDVASIMHYDSETFCKVDASGHCIGPTMTRKDGSRVPGNRDTLSPGDSVALNNLYPEDHPFSFLVLRENSGSGLAMDLGSAASACRAHGYMLPWPNQLPALAAKWRDKVDATGCLWSDAIANSNTKTHVVWSFAAADKKAESDANACFAVCVIDQGALRESVLETQEALVIDNDERNGRKIKVPVKPRSGTLQRFPITTARKAEVVKELPVFRGNCADDTPGLAVPRFSEVTIERGGAIVYTFGDDNTFTLDPQVKDYALVVAVRAYNIDCTGDLELDFHAWD